MEERILYDIHCHAMNLSHPNFSAFIRRMHISFILTVFAPIAGIFMEKEVNKVKNLLAVMENDLGSYFLLMEEDLKNSSDIWCGNGTAEGKLKIGEHHYDKLIITPLMMDFGFKNMSDPQIYYSRLADKPIVEQVTDLFNGIKKYMQESPVQLLEISPFLGINTRNYSLEKIKLLLEKYFKEYDGTYKSLHDNFGKCLEFDGNIDKLGSNYFSGVKLYPPLGFDPWPENEPEELEKVNYLYRFCVSKSIPITIHCSDGGYIVGDPKASEKRTSPEHWEPILSRYPELKINFAHMGKTSKFWKMFSREKWADKIFELVLKYDNVYTDFSCCAFGDKFYKYLSRKIQRYGDAERSKLESRIMFGTDFMINLLYINSYSKYINIFSNVGLLSGEQKHKFCHTNPAAFLFVK